PDALVPPGRDDARRRRSGLALPVSPARGLVERRPRGARHRSGRLARRPPLRDARADRDGDLEELRLQHGDLPCRDAGASRAALRGGPHRWRRRGRAAPPHHASRAGADLPVRRRLDGDRLSAAVRRALRDDGRRPVRPHAQHRAADVSRGLPLVEHGLRSGRRLRALRDHPGRQLAPVAAARARGRRVSARTRLASLAPPLPPAAGAAATCLPLLWMVSASLMPTGEASLGPRLLPSAPTLEHYRALLGRLHLLRNAANSALLAAAVTAISLGLNSLA